MSISEFAQTIGSLFAVALIMVGIFQIKQYLYSLL